MRVRLVIVALLSSEVDPPPFLRVVGRGFSISDPRSTVHVGVQLPELDERSMIDGYKRNRRAFEGYQATNRQRGRQFAK